MTADGETAHRRVDGFCRSNRALIVFDVRRFFQATISCNGKYSDRTAKVVRHQQELAGRMDADISRTVAAGGNRVEQTKLAIRGIYRKRTDGTFFATADAVGFIA